MARAVAKTRAQAQASDRQLHVVRGGADGAAWELTFGRCHEALAPYIREYCGYFERTPEPMRRREMPAAQVVMIIDFGPTLGLLDPAGQRVVARHGGGFIAGLDDRFTLTESTGVMQGIQVNFTPIGGRLFLGPMMAQLARQVVPLADALGADGRFLAEQLQDTSSWGARFRLLDELILRRVRRVQEAAGLADWLGPAWDRIEGTGGGVTVDRLVDEIGYSRKHLAAVFRDQMGMTPKALARLVRFQRALAALRSGRPLDLAQLALELGYYDQAHFTREFRGFAGLTPGECLRRQPPGQLGVAG